MVESVNERIAKMLGWAVTRENGQLFGNDGTYDYTLESNQDTIDTAMDFDPEHNDADALRALDVVLAKPEHQQICVEIANLVDGKGTNGWCARLHFSPEKRLPYIEQLARTRSAAICAALLALGKQEAG